MTEIEALETELTAICAKHGWTVTRTGIADSTNSRYYEVRKPTGLFDRLDCEMEICADVRLSDHENQSRTSYHANRLFNVAGGRFSDSLEAFEHAMVRSHVIDPAEASDDAQLTETNIGWK